MWPWQRQAYKSLDTEDKFVTLFGCGVKIHKINPILGYRVKMTSDINTIYGLIKLSWWLQKGKKIVCRSYVIGHKFINPIDECGD